MMGMLPQPAKDIPDWNGLLDALQNIKGDPLLLEPLKDLLLLLLCRTIFESNSFYYTPFSSYCKCLKKYGITVTKYNQRILGYHTTGFMEKTDWYEAIALAHALDLLVEQQSTEPDVQSFLYKLKVFFWHVNIGPVNERCLTLFTRGKKLYRYYAVWGSLRRLQQNITIRKEMVSFYSLAPMPPYAASLLPALAPPKKINCHYSIPSGELNIFVMYALSSKRALTKSDFWAILTHNQMSFLEYLLLDLPDKRLPYSFPEMALIAIFILQDHNAIQALQMLRLLEKASPGTISGFSDPNGGNLLWYSLFTRKGIPRTNTEGAVVLSPLQSFLYELCDHAKPNCDGISFDDLYRNFPANCFD